MGNQVKQGMLSRQVAEFSERPPFPRAINVELSNVCNHSCSFCAISLMERKQGSMNVAKLEKWLLEAYELGSREIGLHSGAEPFASRYLEHFIKYTKKIGFEYTYISTNGSLAKPPRKKAVMDAGIDSIKFSINAGDRKTYARIHGKDHFDLVMGNLRAAAQYRGSNKKPYLAISFVITRENEHTVEKMRALSDGLVDEFLAFRALNLSGQLPGDGEQAWKDEKICAVPFNKVHISWEGFMRGCCNDYENMLALEDLESMTLAEAYYSERYMAWRRQHLENRLEGSLCFNCKYDRKTPVQPLNPELYFRTHESDKGPKVSFTPIIFKK